MPLYHDQYVGCDPARSWIVASIRETYARIFFGCREIVRLPVQWRRGIFVFGLQGQKDEDERNP